MAYATVEDYEARYGMLGVSEADRVQVQLDDASVKIDALVARYDIDIDKYEQVLTIMACEYVHYQQQFSVGANLSAVTHQAGSFMETYSMRSELSFEKWAMRYFADALGIAGGMASTVKVALHDRSGAIAGELNAW